jgi:hypothetical protein
MDSRAEPRTVPSYLVVWHGILALGVSVVSPAMFVAEIEDG